MYILSIFVEIELKKLRSYLKERKGREKGRGRCSYLEREKGRKRKLTSTNVLLIQVEKMR